MYEISSDSDEDCYDKFPQKLQKLKNKHALNNLVTVLDNSDNPKQIDSNVVNLLSKRDSDVILVPDTTIALDIPPVVVSRSRRGKRKNFDAEYSPVTPKNGGKRGRGRGRGRGKNSQISPSVPQPRGRGRKTRNTQSVISTTESALSTSARRRTRQQRQINQETALNSQSIVTYSIGNTEEYPDASEDLLLFNNKNITTLESSTIIDLDESFNNEELSVKVYWQHSEVIKFNIRRFQKLAQIFDFFVNREGVGQDRLLFTYNYKNTNKILQPDDTPDSIEYNIAKFIEGGIVNKHYTLNSSDIPKKTGFIVKFQCQNRKKPIELSIEKTEKLKLAMLKCAEHLEIPIEYLVFEFDGETVKGNTTPKDLDMESGDCIDVKMMNVNK